MDELLYIIWQGGIGAFEMGRWFINTSEKTNPLKVSSFQKKFLPNIQTVVNYFLNLDRWQTHDFRSFQICYFLAAHQTWHFTFFLSSLLFLVWNNKYFPPFPKLYRITSVYIVSWRKLRSRKNFFAFPFSRLLLEWATFRQSPHISDTIFINMPFNSWGFFLVDFVVLWRTILETSTIGSLLDISLKMVFNRNRSQVFTSKCGPSAMSSSPRSSSC